jgi:uncharacterized integral membrane protein
MVLGILLGVLSIIFIFQNLESVTYTFLFWSLTAPRFLVLLAILLVGMLLGWAIRVMRRKRKKK